MLLASLGEVAGRRAQGPEHTHRRPAELVPEGVGIQRKTSAIGTKAHPGLRPVCAAATVVSNQCVSYQVVQPGSSPTSLTRHSPLPGPLVVERLHLRGDVAAAHKMSADASARRASPGCMAAGSMETRTSPGATARARSSRSKCRAVTCDRSGPSTSRALSRVRFQTVSGTLRDASR